MIEAEESLPGGLVRTATAETERIRAAMVKQATSVARLQLRRRKLRKSLRELDGRIRTERRFLRAMGRDLGGEA